MCVVSGHEDLRGLSALPAFPLGSIKECRWASEGIPYSSQPPLAASHLGVAGESGESGTGTEGPDPSCNLPPSLAGELSRGPGAWGSSRSIVQKPHH